MTRPPGRAWARPGATAAAIAVVFVAALVLSVTLGSGPVDLARALEPGSIERDIVFAIRLPRALLAALAGAGLAGVGATYQAVLRNPLAEPFVLGVSGGAALGATGAIALGVPALLPLGAAVLPASAFAGGALATLLVYVVARGASARGSSTQGATASAASSLAHGSGAVLLAGVMVNAIAASLITFLKVLAPPIRAAQLLRWLTGFVDLPSPFALGAAALYVGAGLAVLLVDAGRCTLLSLGDEEASLLGVDVKRLERRVFLACSAIVGAIVSLTGLIGFVGLVVPHVLRRVVGPDHRRVLPLSIALGAAMLLLCDLASRLAFRALGTEPPVGAITAVVGGPLFLVMLARGSRS